jgi:hypothetical protein
MRNETNDEGLWSIVENLKSGQLVRWLTFEPGMRVFQRETILLTGL